jgi:hypothetical protein
MIYTEFGNTIFDILIQIASDIGGLMGSLQSIFIALVPIIAHGTYIQETSKGMFVDPEEQDNQEYHEWRDRLTKNLAEHNSVDLQDIKNIEEEIHTNRKPLLDFCNTRSFKKSLFFDLPFIKHSGNIFCKKRLKENYHLKLLKVINKKYDNEFNAMNLLKKVNRSY